MTKLLRIISGHGAQINQAKMTDQVNQIFAISVCKMVQG